MSEKHTWDVADPSLFAQFCSGLGQKACTEIKRADEDRSARQDAPNMGVVDPPFGKCHQFVVHLAASSKRLGGGGYSDQTCVEFRQLQLACRSEDVFADV